MSRFLCKCGNTLSDSEFPGDTRYYVYSDYEWQKIIEKDLIEALSIPRPKNDVWQCSNCQRVYVFTEKGEVIKIYALEYAQKEE